MSNTQKENFSFLDADLTAEDVSFYLRNMREFLGLNKKEFADKIGVIVRTYYAYEEGRNMPKRWLPIKNRINILVREKISSK